MIIGLFAVDENGGVGHKGTMPWGPIKEDLQWFKQITLNQVVVMGKKSWHSPDMPKPLPKRTNVVISNALATEIPNAHAVLGGNVPDLLKFVDSEYYNYDVFVIGGVNILLQAKPVLQKLYITRIPGTYEADTRIDLDTFLEGFILTNTNDLGTCKVEEYEAIQ